MSAPVLPSQPKDTAARHTATPWRVSSFEQSAGGAGRVIMGSDGFSIAHVMDRSPAENEVDAAFIVEAVNSHASLKARIQELTKDLRDAEQGMTVDEVLANYRRIRRAALSAAGNGEAGK